MKVTRKSWNEYISRLSKLNEEAGKKMTQYVEQYGIDDSEKLIAYANSLIVKYCEGSSELACQMYDAMAAAEKVNVPPAEPAELPEYREVAKMVNATKKSTKELARGTGRLVKRASADTTLKNAIRDGAEFAWIPNGDTCAFCVTLASRGWQRISKKALKNGHAEHIHANCDCQYAIRFNKKTNVEGYDPDEYLEQYNAAGGDINKMRRVNYKGNKDAINARKRELYARKNSGGLSGAYTNENDPDGKKREKSAKKFYEEIRNRKPEFEIKAVAKNSGMNEKDVERIFNHVFLRKHRFEDGSVKHFDADYYMQNSWMRLREGKNIQRHDLILLQHELAEEKIMGEGLEVIYEIAHNKVEKEYDYARALMDYLKDHDA